jgi:hypothetical protein
VTDTRIYSDLACDSTSLETLLEPRRRVMALSKEAGLSRVATVLKSKRNLVATLYTVL